MKWQLWKEYFKELFSKDPGIKEMVRRWHHPPDRATEIAEEIRVLDALRGGEWVRGYEIGIRADIYSGILYPTLRRMEHFGVIESKWEFANHPRPRLYRLIPDTLYEANIRSTGLT